MSRVLSAILLACALTLATAAAPAAAVAAPPFCAKVRHCMWGGDPGWTWVHARAAGKRQARAVAARLLRNAKAVRKRYHAPAGVTIYVVKKGVCWRKARLDKPSRACTLKRVHKRL